MESGANERLDSGAWFRHVIAELDQPLDDNGIVRFIEHHLAEFVGRHGGSLPVEAAAELRLLQESIGELQTGVRTADPGHLSFEGPPAEAEAA